MPSLGTFDWESELYIHIVFYAPAFLQGKFRAHLPTPENDTILLIPACSGYFLFKISGQMIDQLPLETQTIELHLLKAKLEHLEQLLQEKNVDKLIGIPTLEGFDFIAVKEIIRCEGLQKCTRIVTTSKTDIISSYNIGEFRKLLEPYFFFSPHKSHLINLAFLKKYKREGTIMLRDNACIPVSKRKKSEFLELVIHL